MILASRNPVSSRNRVSFCLFLLLVSMVAGCAGPPSVQPPPPPSTAAPALSIRLNQQGHAAFEVVGLAAGDLMKLAGAEFKPEQWTRLLAVYVDNGNVNLAGQPAVLGSYRVDGVVLRFEPKYPLVPGLRYLALFDLSKLPGNT